VLLGFVPKLVSCDQSFRFAAFPVGGSGATNGAQPPGVAQQACPPDDAAGTENRRGAMARKLAVRLYWTMRKEWDYEQLKKFGSHAGQPGYRDGVKSNIE
jgi:hypothetical protein